MDATRSHQTLTSTSNRNASARTAAHAAVVGILTMLLFAIASGLGAQALTAEAMSLTSLSDPPSVRRPFGVGEVLRYEATFGRLKVGEGQLEVSGIEDVRGRPAWHLVFRITGGVPFYRIDDLMESWVDTGTMTSVRFTKVTHEGRRHRTQRFEIDANRGVYQEEGKEALPTVARPLDDGAFFYYVRTLPLQVGDRYLLNNYFRPDRNPVQVSVVRRERVKVPAGEFDAIVLRPVIRTSGMLSQSRKTELWVTDDDSRILVQVQSHLPFGTITLKLKQRVDSNQGTASRF
jgi:hypothetical protein